MTNPSEVKQEKLIFVAEGATIPPHYSRMGTFASRGPTTLSISRLVTGLVTVNGNRQPVWEMVPYADERRRGQISRPTTGLVLSLPDDSRNDLDWVLHLAEQFRASLLLLLPLPFRS